MLSFLGELVVLFLEKIGKVLSLLFICSIIGIFTTLCTIFYFSLDLPDYTTLQNYTPYTVSRLYSTNGKVMQEYGYERRIYTPYNEIPKLVINAFLAAEDIDYFQHEGIKPINLIKAASTNLINIGKKKLIGRSTITQQVIKNILLSNEVTFVRKIKEAILAYRISKIYSKEHILELYLNQIFLGDNSYGISSASLNYFNKSLSELTIEESALLAALPKAPTKLNPKKHYAKAKARRNWVIKRMLLENIITMKQAQKALSTKIILKNRRKISFINGEFYTEKVRQDLVKMIGKKALNTEGISVFTNFNKGIQEIATIALRKALLNYDKKYGYRGAIGYMKPFKKNIATLAKYNDSKMVAFCFQPAVVTNIIDKGIEIALQQEDKSKHIVKNITGYIQLQDYKWAMGREKKISNVIKYGDIIAVRHIKGDLYKLEQIPEVNGAVVAIEPRTGKVRALVGGYDYSSSMFDRATQASRQPGSVFKPFVYLAALESGYAPNSMINDEPIAIEQAKHLPLWIPKNYTPNYLGTITMRKALERSANLAIINVAKDVGLKKVSEVAIRLGIYSTLPSFYSTALGSYETTLMKMTNAFNIIASNGKNVVPSYIDRIYDKRGKLVYQNKNFICQNCEEKYTGKLPIIVDNLLQIVDKDINYQLLSMLEGVVKRGTSRRANVIGYNLAGKTGTTNESRDVWYIGVSPDITIGIYIGYDQPRSLGKYESGATLALPVYIDIMQNLKKNIKNRKFEIPDGIITVKIDSLTGLPPDEHSNPRNIIKETFTKHQVSNNSIKNLAHKFGIHYDKKAIDKSIGDEFGGLY